MRADTMARIRGTTSQIEAAAKQLRQTQTPAEQKLWQALRGRKLNGLKFRRQHPIGHFIVDFYCPECKLIVEVDGKIHDSQQDYDTTRTKHLEAYGYRVIRCQNKDVMTNLEVVLEGIRQVASCPSQGKL
ncbi:MAG: endonuclease domain-containing protein [Coleofasciculus sp. A1-SPW-01]|uniref:endonuclease domain-containing protein n=1 Tax=Coleofasciculus sp. A1-SPW-01 TaxID=3070819 RepID=UPI003303D845